MEKFQISCLANVEKCSEEGELTLALPERGIEGSIGVHEAAKADDTASAQVQTQDTTQHGAGLFFLSCSIELVIIRIVTFIEH